MTTPMSSPPVASTEAATGTDAEETCRSPHPATAPVAPAVCILRFAGDSMAGAFMGSIFGFGKGLFNKKGFKGSFGEAGSSARTFAVFSGVHSLVSCLMKRMRGKDDAVNAGVAGCCTGVALSFPGAPQILLQNCLMFGAFSYVMEGLNKQQPALANSSPGCNSIINLPSPTVLPPFSLPLPSNIMEDFSSFCKSLTKPKNATAW